MASLTKTETGWLVRWKTPDRQSRKKTFDRKPDAERFKVGLEHDLMAGAYVDPAAGRVSFRAYAEGWRAVQVHRPQTERGLRGMLERDVYPVLGDRPIAAIRPSEVRAALKGWSDRLAPSTSALVYRWVRVIFNAAVSDHVIARSPCAEVRLPPEEERQMVPLSVETVAALVAGVPDRYRALVILGAGAGPRISEALGLTVDRVDFLRRRVRVDRQLVGVADGVPIFGPVKDRRNRPRTVPLPDVVIDTLAEHVRRFGTGPDELVFTTDSGRPISSSTWSGVWRRAAEPLGLPRGDGFHQLRHFYASALIHHGESVKVVQTRLGHASAAMVLRVYGHLWPDSEDRTRAAIDTTLGGLGSVWGPRADRAG
jgi:integrase